MENTNYYKYQVFINFRGKDERHKFVSHLKYHLIDNNVNVFIDEDGRGDPLNSLLEQIQKSRMAIVIFTKNYAESSWCLDELAEIKKCIETKKLDYVIPIFYKVKASTVKKQSLNSKFGKKFEALQNSLFAEIGDSKKKWKRANSRIKRWKKALRVVTGMNGLTYEKQGRELDFVKKVVENVLINLAKIAAEEECNSIRRTTKHRLTKSMGPLSLERWNVEDYDNESVDDWHHPHYRRTFSFYNDRDHHYRLPDVTSLATKPVVNRWTTEDALRFICNVLSCLCLTSGQNDEPEFSRK